MECPPPPSTFEENYGIVNKEWQRRRHDNPHSSPTPPSWTWFDLNFVWFFPILKVEKDIEEEEKEKKKGKKKTTREREREASQPEVSTERPDGTVGWPSNERADRSGLRLLWRRHDDATLKN